MRLEHEAGLATPAIECALQVQKQAKDLRFANYTAPMEE